MNVTFVCRHCDRSGRASVDDATNTTDPGENRPGLSPPPHTGSSARQDLRENMPEAGSAGSAASAATHTWRCPHCRAQYSLHRQPSGLLEACGVCGCRELFVRKDFSQRLGLAIVFGGILLSSIAWAWYRIYWSYGILFATALVDVVLYFTVGDLLQCYRCAAQYRGLESSTEHAAFDLEIHERLRQQEARLPEAGRERV